jgi:glycosyltransferase involved in cell wall biosynthesis
VSTNKLFMISAIKRRYATYRYVFVGADFHSEGGAWRSIHALYKYLDGSSEAVLLADLRRGDGWKQWICSLLFAPRIVVNGMAAVERWGVLAGLALRKNVAVYLHDTAYMLDALQRDKPRVYRCLARLLRNRPVLCVSERMAELYQKRFGAINTIVVYEVTELDPEPKLDSKKVHLVMVGSLNRRKGYPLFVKTAEEAAKRGMPWHFHWIGGLGEPDLAPISSVITWWGWRASATPIVKQADAFFLTSEDDPQPLACLEALALGKRAIVYAGTGSAELVEGLPGCRVFARHDVADAIGAIRSALAEEPDLHLHREAVARHSDVGVFHRRLESVFSGADD